MSVFGSGWEIGIAMQSPRRRSVLLTEGDVPSRLVVARQGVCGQITILRIQYHSIEVAVDSG